MQDYKPNSHRFKDESKKVPAERRKVEKVIKGNVRTKKKSNASKLVETFISEDVSSVKSYIFQDVIIPVIKKTVCDIFADIPNMIFYGSPARNRRSSSSHVDHVSYNKYSDKRDDRRYNDDSRRKSIFDLDLIEFDERGEAEKVLMVMDEIMKEYDLVRVADFYDLVGMSCDHTANDYGWTNIRNAEVVPVRGGGWIIKMPRAIPIK